MATKLQPGDPGHVRFKTLRLQATRLEEMRKFYSRTLGFPLLDEQNNSLTVKFGGTAIEFAEQRGTAEPFYHFAFNISENKFPQAKAWLAARCPLLKSPQGADEFFFEFWNAHAVYFQDPAGNIVELIARHTLDNSRRGDFELEDVLYASEIGLASEDPASLGRELGERFGLAGGGSLFVGDASGFFVLPEVGRLWIPEERQRATKNPVDVTLVAGPNAVEFLPPDLPYRIRPAN